MAYIVQRKDRFYAVDYDGLDPLTGRKRRRWHPAATREDAEQVAGDGGDAGWSPGGPK